jgi:hypothetical protein
MPVAKQIISNEMIWNLLLKIDHRLVALEKANHIEEDDEYICPYGYSHTPNAETIAAFEEGDAIERGEIPGQWFNSVDEMWAALNEDN